MCGAVGPIVRHHIVYEQHIRRAGHPELRWDLRNALDVGVTCSCHHDHHWAIRRIPFSLVDEQASEFAIEVLGMLGAACFFERYYRGEEA